MIMRTSRSPGASGRLFAALAALAMLVPGPAAAQLANLRSALNASLDATRRASATPGVAAVMTWHGKTVWSTAIGRAVVSTRIPFQRQTLCSIGSVTKMVTATIVLRMVELGMLQLDAPISTYLAANIPAKSTVTLRQLLGMQSGYNDVEATDAFSAVILDPNYRWTYDKLFQLIEAPHFTPGSQVEYNNTNYILLSAIVQNTYPGGVAAAFRTLVAKPAGLADDMSFTRDPKVAYRFAHGYFTYGGKTIDVNRGARFLGVPTATWGTIWGDGGVAATASGLARFADALYGGRIVSPATLAMMKPATPASEYGLGMTNLDLDTRQWIGHEGGFPGYVAVIAHDDARDATFSVIANALDIDTRAQAQIIAGLVKAFDDYVAK
ncbi:MAG: serine hydrolase domain-containing protein [Thermohalobaculum sp.]